MDQTIRLIKPYSLHAKGKLLTLAPGIAGELIRTGRAELVTPEPPKTEEKSNEACRPLKTKKKRR